MTAFLALIASVAALALAFFVYRTSSDALFRKDAAAVFVVLPVVFSAWAVGKTNPWLAGLAVLLVVVGWIYVLRTGRAKIDTLPRSNAS